MGGIKFKWGEEYLGHDDRHDTAYVTSDFRDFQAGNNPKAITFFAKSFLRLHFFSTNTLTLKSSLSSTFVMQQRRGGSCNRKQTIAPPPPLPKRRTHRKQVLSRLLGFCYQRARWHVTCMYIFCGQQMQAGQAVKLCFVEWLW